MTADDNGEAGPGIPQGIVGGVARVRDALSSLGHSVEIREFASSTRTSADAAASIGCKVGQIAKSLVFRLERSGGAVLVIASGSNRVDEAKLEARLGEPVVKADAPFVREATGFAIGGVAPVGHRQPIGVLIDADLALSREIWAAAGSPNAVFRLSFEDLRRLTGGEVLDLKQ